MVIFQDFVDREVVVNEVMSSRLSSGWTPAEKMINLFLLFAEWTFVFVSPVARLF